jgi:hypothetical protein
MISLMSTYRKLLRHPIDASRLRVRAMPIASPESMLAAARTGIASDSSANSIA